MEVEQEKDTRSIVAEAFEKLKESGGNTEEDLELDDDAELGDEDELEKEKEEESGEAKEEEQEKKEEPEIPAPASFSAEEKEAFYKLTPEMQRAVVRREKDLQGRMTRASQEAAEYKKRLDSYEAQIQALRQAQAQPGTTVQKDEIALRLERIERRAAQEEESRFINHWDQAADSFKRQKAEDGSEKYPYFDELISTMTEMVGPMIALNPKLDPHVALNRAYKAALADRPDLEQLIERTKEKRLLRKKSEQAAKSKRASTSVKPGGAPAKDKPQIDVDNLSMREIVARNFRALKNRE